MTEAKKTKTSRATARKPVPRIENIDGGEDMALFEPKAAPLDEGAVAAYYQLTEQIKQLTAKKDVLAKRFKDELPKGTFPVGEFIYECDTRMGASLDKGAFRRDHSPETSPQFWTLEPNNAAIKEELGESRREYYSDVTYLKITKRKAE